MKKSILIVSAGICMVLLSCGKGKETKTLYGSWMQVQEYVDSTKTWIDQEGEFILDVKGKCEAIEVTQTQRGDLANPDIKLPDAKCYGDRDELSFTVDPEDNGVKYDLKLDASKDSLIGTATYSYSNTPQPYVAKVKFARLGIEKK